jgi:hypothetical protein
VSVNAEQLRRLDALNLIRASQDPAEVARIVDPYPSYAELAALVASLADTAASLLAAEKLTMYRTFLLAQ